MSFTSELVQAGVKHISKKAAKFFNQMPVDDIAGTVRAVNRHPNEFADMMKHVNNYADKGDQSGILPYVQYQNKWKNEGVEDLRNSQTLTHGINKGSANQDKLYPQGQIMSAAPMQQQSVIKGPSARKILGNQQLANPPAKRSKSIPPNLPQEVIEEYTQESSARLRAGEKNRVDVPYLVDADDRVYRLDQKGWEYDGDIKQKKYALIDVDLKRARNAKLDKIRQQKVNLTTRAGTDQKDFYADPDPKARHKKGTEEPHHRAPLHPSARLKSGLSKREGSMLDNFLESKGIVTGNSKYNRDNLPNEVHKKLHSWLKKNKLLTGNEDLTDLTLAQRKKYITQFVADMQKSDAKTFKIMQAFNRLTKRKTKWQTF